MNASLILDSDSQRPCASCDSERLTEHHSWRASYPAGLNHQPGISLPVFPVIRIQSERWLVPTRPGVMPLLARDCRKRVATESRKTVARPGDFEQGIFTLPKSQSVVGSTRHGYSGRMERLHCVTRRCEGRLTAVKRENWLFPAWREASSSQKTCPQERRRLQIGS